jgi:hypothetical protein
MRALTALPLGTSWPPVLTFSGKSSVEVAATVLKFQFVLPTRPPKPLPVWSRNALASMLT